MERSDVAARIVEFARQKARPIVVGVSGYCGSGKSTLARWLVDELPGAIRMRGDDFLDPTRSHRRSSDWDGVERTRLVSTVLTPFRRGEPGTFQRYDWSLRRLGGEEALPTAEMMILDVIGLFHPDALPALDVSLWCDVDQETAAQRGMARDRALGRDHDALWNAVWMPNDRDFFARFSPREGADHLVDSLRDGARSSA